MISLYQLFKIIFGLVISGFTLFVILNFTGVYIGIQEDSQRAAILKNFIKTAGDVYISGNPAGFDDFSRQDFTLSFDISEPEGIVSQAGKTPVFFPLFLSPGKRLFIYRNELDLGWWKFRFIEAMPRTRIFFNPRSASPEAWELVRSIVLVLPDS
jgi:hypothetical protein